MIDYNRHIFDTIDNEDKAYWLGFIIADGYLNLDKNMLRIKLGRDDKEHLIKFISFINGDIEMLKTEQHNITNNTLYYVSLYSKEIKNALLSLNVEQAKSGHEKVPPIESKYHRAFIRGLWDGDGFIRENLKGIGLVGSEEVLKFVQNHFQEILNIKPLKIYSHCNTFKIEYRSTKKSVPEILKYLYQEDEVGLDRKIALVNKL